MSETSKKATIRVNPIACEGVAICAHLAPDVLALDRWGFPITPKGPVQGSELDQAKRAARGCPKRALLIEAVQ